MILNEINRIKKLNPSLDINSIFRIAANKIGYKIYNDSVTDNDLLSGLKLINLEDINCDNIHYSPYGNYDGKLI